MKHGPIGFIMIRKWVLYHLFLKSLLKEQRFSSSKATPGKTKIVEHKHCHPKQKFFSCDAEMKLFIIPVMYEARRQ